jgi:hypothetical protein
MQNKALTPIEQEFKELVDAHIKEINEQIDIAREAIGKAEKLSDKYGLPFSSDITPLGMGYTPQSFYDKYGQDEDGDNLLDKSWVCDLTGAYPGGEYGYSGWEHSAVC